MTNLEFSQVDCDGWKMRVRQPAHPVNAPVLLAVHGLTGDEHSMDVFTSRIPEDYWIFSLRAPFIADPGFSWVYKKGSGLPAYPDFSYAASEIVRRMGTWFKKLGVSPTEIDLCGFSQGGALCLCLLNDYPALFNKTAVLAGFLPEGKTENPFLGNVEKKTIFASHGSLDETIPVQFARVYVRLLEEAGASVTYCEEAVGHKLGASCFNGLRQFFYRP